MPFAQADGGTEFTDRQSQAVPPRRVAGERGEDNAQQNDDNAESLDFCSNHPAQKGSMPTNARLRCISVFISEFNMQPNVE
jgi:hypothetical protein